jgi:NhaA family Na+:H+ antiporter
VSDARGPLLLLAATGAALALANSPLADAYEHALHLPLALGLTVHHFVNDALMAVFFFLVGMEIKRELVIGELSSASRAALPAIGALGGMIVPAGLYAALHASGPAARGWGIPMATDIAFAVAALRVFGARVPKGLEVFLLALAIIDDIGAVLVIAIFYASALAPAWIAGAAAGLALCAVLGRRGVGSYWMYVAIGTLVWYATFRSGVHATIAGVALGLLTPARPLAGRSVSPIDELEHRLHGWVGLVILPIFALCNAGVTLDAGSLGDPMAQRVAFGRCARAAGRQAGRRDLFPRGSRCAGASPSCPAACRGARSSASGSSPASASRWRSSSRRSPSKRARSSPARSSASSSRRRWRRCSASPVLAVRLPRAI